MSENVEAARVSARRDEILDAALEEIGERGYKGASTLAIARRARTSKETIYNWFGSKRGLFAALVERHVASLEEWLQRPQGEAEPEIDKALTLYAVRILEWIVEWRSITVLRTAVAEVYAHPEFARLLLTRNIHAAAPVLVGWLERKRGEGRLDFEDANEAFEVFLGLLIGGIEVPLLLGFLPPLGRDAVERRADRAVVLFLRLYSVGDRG